MLRDVLDELRECVVLGLGRLLRSFRGLRLFLIFAIRCKQRDYLVVDDAPNFAIECSRAPGHRLDDAKAHRIEALVATRERRGDHGAGVADGGVFLLSHEVSR